MKNQSICCTSASAESRVRLNAVKLDTRSTGGRRKKKKTIGNPVQLDISSGLYERLRRSVETAAAAHKIKRAEWVESYRVPTKRGKRKKKV